MFHAWLPWKCRRNYSTRCRIRGPVYIYVCVCVYLCKYVCVRVYRSQYGMRNPWACMHDVYMHAYTQGCEWANIEKLSNGCQNKSLCARVCMYVYIYIYVYIYMYIYEQTTFTYSKQCECAHGSLTQHTCLTQLNTHKTHLYLAANTEVLDRYCPKFSCLPSATLIASVA